jgi:Fe2+ transport system protein FeoA
MKDNLITCSMCGFSFDPCQHATCQGCPVQKGCQLISCPNCGYETVNPQQSSLVRWITGLKRHFFKQHGFTKPLPSTISLTDVSPGSQAHIMGFDPRMPINQRIRLQAYGLTPGQTVRVHQHTPVTILQIEHLELALEYELAQAVLVDQQII